MFVIGGGVEDSTLEAKAKDTKNIRGQGPTFRGQTLSRPRTGMLETKAKDPPKKTKISQIFHQIQAFSNKKQIKQKRFHKLSVMSLASSRTKKRNGHDLDPFSTNQKNSAILGCKQGIFEDLKALRPRT